MKSLRICIPVTLLACAALPAQITVTLSPGGNTVIKQTTGYTPKNASLLNLEACNDGDATPVSTSRIRAEIIYKEQYGLYSSQAITDVLAALQGKDVFARAQKLIVAGKDTATLLTAMFKTLSPTAVAVIQGAPDIARAILPAVGDPRDLAQFSRQIMQDSESFALGKKGAGNDCRTGMVVAMSGTVKIDRIVVQ